MRLSRGDLLGGILFLANEAVIYISSHNNELSALSSWSYPYDVDLLSNAHIPKPLQAPTVPVVILDERYVQLYAFHVLKFESVGEDADSGF